jgi:hypothetical protein
MNMKIKIVRVITSSILISFLFHDPAYSIPTKWEDAGVSLSTLLNSNWQVIAHSTSRVAANSNAGNSFDVKSFTFLLTKGGKFILCNVEGPTPPVANDTGCRRLN